MKQCSTELEWAALLNKLLYLYKVYTYAFYNFVKENLIK